MRREWLFLLIPLTVGVGFLGYGVYGFRRARVLRRIGVTAQGRIVRHNRSRSDEGTTFYHPVAAWTTADGRACEHASSFGRSSIASPFRVGADVTVRYDPDRPRRFEIQGWDGAAVNFVFTILGSFFTAGALVAFLIGLFAF
ncbi:DUF3592 domain-containing protein [Streptomyces sp. NBC_01426]|nr:DUF3592 domain-containing protein [Streptomyces sp. NBC_01426]